MSGNKAVFAFLGAPSAFDSEPSSFSSNREEACFLETRITIDATDYVQNQNAMMNPHQKEFSPAAPLFCNGKCRNSIVSVAARSISRIHKGESSRLFS